MDTSRAAAGGSGEEVGFDFVVLSPLLDTGLGTATTGPGALWVGMSLDDEIVLVLFCVTTTAGVDVGRGMVIRDDVAVVDGKVVSDDPPMLDEDDVEDDVEVEVDVDVVSRLATATVTCVSRGDTGKPASGSLEGILDATLTAATSSNNWLGNALSVCVIVELEGTVEVRMVGGRFR